MTLQEMEFLLLHKFPSWDKSKEYFELISNNLLKKKEKFKTQAHHILPKSLFPQYEDFKKFCWNKVNLSLEDHARAHFYLSFTKDYGMCSSYRFLGAPVSDVDFKTVSENLKILAESKSEFFKSLWADKDYHTRVSNSIKNAWATNPNLKLNASLRAKEHFACHKVRENLSNTMKELFKDKDLIKRMSEIAKINSNNPITKAKKAEITRNFWKSDDYRKRQSESRKASRNSEEVKNKIEKTLRAKSKPFVMMDLDGNIIKEFCYIPDALNFISSKGSNISAALKGKRPTAYGYKWKYV